ncbi:MAG: heme biosynthesis protein HemY [Rhodocyclaceae bacterium]|nr:heme biosynthesis protein HemY [Rhodocyclaceae bacterium]MBX3667919.1 heme biosynthesis protein HemY [Rhodocyclaceae bacterium]
MDAATTTAAVVAAAAAAAPDDAARRPGLTGLRMLFWLIALFALAVGLAVSAQYNRGYVLLQWMPYRIQMSVNLFVLLLFLLFWVLYVIVRVLGSALSMPRAVAEFRARLLAARHQRALIEATALHMAGRYGQAIKQAQIAYAGGASPGLAAVIAARSSQAMRDEARAAEWFARAAEHDGEIRTARLLTEAEALLAQRRFTDAAERLQTLASGGGRHLAAMRLALRAAEGAGDWDAVLRTARLMQKRKALTPEQAASVLQRAQLRNIAARDADADELNQYWSAQPAAERADPIVVQAYAQALIKAGDGERAQKLIEDALEKAWDSRLALLYGQCPGAGSHARLMRAERWLERQPDDANLLFALGRMCVAAQLWGKAQSYLEASLALLPARTTTLELALLHERLQHGDAAAAAFRAAALFDTPA